jgi:hypothetical protein
MPPFVPFDFLKQCAKLPIGGLCHQPSIAVQNPKACRRAVTGHQPPACSLILSHAAPKVRTKSHFLPFPLLIHTSFSPFVCQVFELFFCVTQKNLPLYPYGQKGSIMLDFSPHEKIFFTKKENCVIINAEQERRKM